MRITACGVCGSDSFLQDGGFVGSPLPVVPGHEAAGVVDAIGPGVDDLAPGAQVALYYISTPDDDPWSAAGFPNRSRAVRRMGVDLDGAFAEYVVRPRSTLIVPPSPLPPAELAVLTDAVATPLHALRRVARVQPGESVAVIGIGGLGSNAVQLAKVFGCRVTAISRTAEKLRLASRLGADHTVTAGPTAVGAVRDLTGGIGADVVLQCADAPAAYQLALDVAAPGGRVALIGSCGEPVPIRPMQLIWGELQMLGSRGFIPADIREAIDLRIADRIRLDHLLEAVRPLEEAQTALDDLRAGRLLRSVLVP